MHDSAAPPSVHQRQTPRWLEWTVVAVVLLILVCQLVVRPAAVRLLEEVGNAIGLIAAAGAAVAIESHAEVCRQIEQDPQVRALLGDDVRCAPLEEATWPPQTREGLLEYDLPVEGAAGERATAHVAIAVAADGLTIDSIVVSAKDGAVLVLPLD